MEPNNNTLPTNNNFQMSDGQSTPNQPTSNPYTSNLPASKKNMLPWLIGVIVVLILVIGVLVGVLIATLNNDKADEDVKNPQTSQNSNDNHVSSGTSSENESTTDEDEEAAMLAEITAVIAAHSGGEVSDYEVTLRDSGIEDSPYKPYQRIWVNVTQLNAATGGYLVQLWRKDKNSPWQYGLGLNGIPDCFEYDTDDMRKAFAGQECYADATTLITLEP